MKVREAPLVALVDLVVGVVEAAESESAAVERRDKELEELARVPATGVELALVAGATAGPDADALLVLDITAKWGDSSRGINDSSDTHRMSSPDSGWVTLTGGIVWPEDKRETCEKEEDSGVSP
jgi:hypothetical protein